MSVPKSPNLSGDIRLLFDAPTENAPSLVHGNIVDNGEQEPRGLVPRSGGRIKAAGFKLVPFDNSGFEGGFEVHKDGSWIGQLYLLRKDGFVAQKSYEASGYLAEDLDGGCGVIARTPEAALESFVQNPVTGEWWILPEGRVYDANGNVRLALLGEEMTAVAKC